MIIDRNYIIQRVNQLIKDKQNEESYVEKSYGFKQRLPEFISSRLFPLPKRLKKIITHPINPFYFGYQQYKASKAKKNILITPLHGFATDFLQYYVNNDFSFDTSIYYQEEDFKELTSFIDNRLKSVIAGYEQCPISFPEEEMQKKMNALIALVEKRRKWYVLHLDGNDYFLPDKYLFEEHTYIHDYGLKYLPDYVKEYIAGKDFLDIGAFWGDTSILLAKKYKPNHIYSYEPVSLNRNQLDVVVTKNQLENTISVVPKGVGEKESQIDIYINPIYPSSSSVNEYFRNSFSQKETIFISTIDKECINKKVGVVKIDIEGFEYEAIKGGIETIKRDKPVLLISVYHRAKDFFEIPPLLKEIVPEYSFRFLNLAVTNPFSEKILVAYLSASK